jgi:hypothetical protein
VGESAPVARCQADRFLDLILTGKVLTTLFAVGLDEGGCRFEFTKVPHLDVKLKTETALIRCYLTIHSGGSYESQ